MKAEYRCNCINYNDIFSDATEIARAVENSQKIKKIDFYNLVDILPEHKKLKKVLYSKAENLFILYNIDKDIHYFYL
jgi:hypothetical protein